LVKRAICQVLAGAERGGLERHFVDLCNALSDRHQVTAIAHPMHAGALSAAVRFVPLDLAGSRFSPRVLLELYRALRDAMPDLVHTHANKATAMVALLKPLLSMSFVATLHNHKSRMSMFNRCDAVIAVSRSLADSFPKRVVEVIPNGIAPPQTVAPARVDAIRASLHNIPLVLAVGRLVEAKGFDLLLQAWSDIPAQLWIAGDGPQRGLLQAGIEQRGLAERVTLLGERDDIAILMAAAELLVMPSRREGFSYVLIEALHQRLPVIAARVPGAIDMVPEGWLFDVDDVAGLSALLKTALGGLQTIGDDFSATWERALVECSLERMVTATEAVYRKVLRA
jgi:glycosyltransferase involved in cell wall biosynthesis